FLRNLLGPPSHQKEQKIGDESLPSAPRPSPLVWSGPNKGSGHRSQMTRRPVAMPCVRPPTAAIASTFGLTPGARASGDYSTRSLTRSMSRSECRDKTQKSRRPWKNILIFKFPSTAKTEIRLHFSRFDEINMSARSAIYKIAWNSHKRD